MDIVLLNKDEYIKRDFLSEYTTTSYLDIIINSNKYEIVEKAFLTPQNKSSVYNLFESWLEDPIAYGAFIEEKLIGIVEGSIESWNNRFRITNILVFAGYRHQGVGQKLMDKMIEVAKNKKVRMIVLETQSCNINAISFYKKNGFEIIGWDLFNYSNNDLEKNEVRIEMGKFL